MFGVSVMGSYSLGIQLWLHVTGGAFLTTSMLRMKTGLATSGSCKVGYKRETNKKSVFAAEKLHVKGSNGI